jgi:hypothetical protein
MVVAANSDAVEKRRPHVEPPEHALGQPVQAHDQQLHVSFPVTDRPVRSRLTVPPTVASSLNI